MWWDVRVVIARREKKEGQREKQLEEDGWGFGAETHLECGTEGRGGRGQPRPARAGARHAQISETCWPHERGIDNK